MWSHARVVAVVGAMSVALFGPSLQIANAQTSPTPAEGGLATRPGAAPGANNGVGTAGSLDANPGKASSTVSGVSGGKTGFGAGSSSQGAGGKVESDPTLGGSKKPE